MKTETINISDDQALALDKAGYAAAQEYFDAMIAPTVSEIIDERKTNLINAVLPDADLVAQIVEDKKLDPITFAPVQDQEVAS